MHCCADCGFTYSCHLVSSFSGGCHANCYLVVDNMSTFVEPPTAMNQITFSVLPRDLYFQVEVITRTCWLTCFPLCHYFRFLEGIGSLHLCAVCGVAFLGRTVSCGILVIIAFGLVVQWRLYNRTRCSACSPRSDQADKDRLFQVQVGVTLGRTGQMVGDRL